MSHECHAEGCSVEVNPRFFACRRHWAMVPPALQRALYAVYVQGQENTKIVTNGYLIVQTACRIAIAEREGNSIGQHAASADMAVLIRRCFPEQRRDFAEVVAFGRQWAAEHAIASLRAHRARRSP